MFPVHPLFKANQVIDDAKGTNKLYLDTMNVSALRKQNSEATVQLKQIITEPRSKLRLYYSSAHLGDFTQDQTSEKDADLKFMGSIGMTKYLAYNHYERATYLSNQPPYTSFYNGRFSQEESSAIFNELVKPGMEKAFSDIYEWYRDTLINYEKDKGYLNKLRKGDIKAFLDLNGMIATNSTELTKKIYLDSINEYYIKTATLPKKDHSKQALHLMSVSEKYISYNNQTFDLMRPNLIDQLIDTSFKKDLRQHFIAAMHIRGEDFQTNYNEGHFFKTNYGMLQILGVEPDKPSKFNVRSTGEDSSHCYFASMCNYLVTEDDGLYRRAKILYGVMDVTTKVFKLAEFVKYISEVE